MREIIIDTETTGLDPLSGHRVVEIGAVELVDHAPTGRTFHCYLNPERAMPADAVAVQAVQAWRDSEPARQTNHAVTRPRTRRGLTTTPSA
jgi:hypothetical protein